MKPGAPRVWTLAQAAPTALKTVLVASRALQGLEGVCEAVSEHRHLASMADTAREEAKASAGGALVRMLHSLDGRREDKKDRICVSSTRPSAAPSSCTLGGYGAVSASDGGGPQSPAPEGGGPQSPPQTAEDRNHLPQTAEDRSHLHPARRRTTAVTSPRRRRTAITCP